MNEQKNEYGNYETLKAEKWKLITQKLVHFVDDHEDALAAVDPDVWNEFSAVLFVYCYNVARSMLKTTGRHDQKLFEDLAQDATLKIFKSFSKSYTSKKGKITTWVTKITRNVIIDYLRKSENKIVYLGDEALQFRASDTARPDDLVGHMQQIEKLNRMLDKLKPTQQEMLIDYYFLGRTAQAMANDPCYSQCTKGAIESRIRYLLRKLNDLWYND